MELMAVVVALESLKSNSHPIIVYSDSKYVIDSIDKGWVDSWQRNGFIGRKNKDLWERFLKVRGDFEITYEWVKGHNGHPENERCDVLAVNAATSDNLIIDDGYVG